MIPTWLAQMAAVLVVVDAVVIITYRIHDYRLGRRDRDEADQ